MSTIAGGAATGFTGDGGQATAALLNFPAGLAFDTAGNLYFCDSGNNRVRKIDTAGVITTVAGNGIAGFSGDTGPATAAQLNSPIDVVVDSTGKLFIADYGNHRIRVVQLDGTIGTAVGTGIGGFNGDNFSAVTAQINNPAGLALDGTLGLYIADTANHRIRYLNFSNGILSTVAGIGTASFSGDGGAATAAALTLTNAFGFPEPCGLSKDSSGNLFLADRGNFRVRKIDSLGNISTVAGDGSAGLGSDDVAATSSSTDCSGIFADGSGNLFIADTVNHRIRRVDGSGIITTVAGLGTQGFSGDGGDATLAQLRDPYAITFNSAGEMVIADAFNHRLRKVSAPTPSISVSRNPEKIDTPVTFSVSIPGASSFSWNFGDATLPVNGNPVTHSFASEGLFTVTVTDDLMRSFTTTMETLAPNLGAVNVPNASVGVVVTNPLTDVTSTIASANGGLIELELGITSLDRGVASASTFFDDIPNRTATVQGTRPLHKFTQPGIFTATTTITDAGTGELRGRARKTLVVGALETAQSSALPPPPTPAISFKSIKGKFLFNSDKPDQVTFQGSITLPAGFDIARPDGHSFSIGIGNVIDTIQLDPKGKGLVPSEKQFISKAKVKYPRLKGTTVTVGGEIAQFQITYKIDGLEIKGFDTEGVVPSLRSDEVDLKSAPRKIQVQVLVEGVAYEAIAPASYKLSKKADSGIISGRAAR